MREGQTEVLVAGAGPVGLWMALLLAKAGIEVTLIDREARTAARSYACALHPRTLAMLAEAGLAEAALSIGRKVERIAFYEGDQPRAELRLGDAGGEFPFLLILPQNALESLLERGLNEAGVKVSWNHRFDDLVEEEEKVTVAVEELGGTSTGYIVPHWEAIVNRRRPLRAQFLVGTDGHNSLVRQRLGIEFLRQGEPESFAAYEFESPDKTADEVRVAFEGGTTNVLWPLPNNKYRWTFQVLRSELGEFPEKERRSVRLDQPEIDERIRQYVEKVAQRRAPWFSAGAAKIAWCSAITFERRLVREYGRNRCWLAGDAAHQTGPVGVQSMNAGFAEAQALARSLAKVLRQQSGREVLASYNHQFQEEWQRLLGFAGGYQAGGQSAPWVRDHVSRLLPCLPAFGSDLNRLCAQIGMEVTGPRAGEEAEAVAGRK